LPVGSGLEPTVSTRVAAVSQGRFMDLGSSRGAILGFLAPLFSGPSLPRPVVPRMVVWMVDDRRLLDDRLCILSLLLLRRQIFLGFLRFCPRLHQFPLELLVPPLAGFLLLF